MVDMEEILDKFRCYCCGNLLTREEQKFLLIYLLATYSCECKDCWDVNEDGDSKE